MLMWVQTAWVFIILDDMLNFPEDLRNERGLPLLKQLEVQNFINPQASCNLQIHQHADPNSIPLIFADQLHQAIDLLFESNSNSRMAARARIPHTKNFCHFEASNLKLLCQRAV